MYFKILFACFMSLALTTGSEVSQVELVRPKVCPEHVGCIVGKLMPGYQTEFFEAFLGIPYAMPPVGELRLNNPHPYPKTETTIDASEPKAECIQKHFQTSEITGAEDCLYLNVYSPVRNESPPKLLPVLVYLHEGGFFMGTANPNVLGPQYIMDTKKVVLVTIAYRLGPMGFLSTNDSVMPGNFGMKDQRLALKWIQQNIKDFGGDHNQVTLFGLSAGGISTHLHMLSKNSKGLFQRAIALSGWASSPIAYQRSPLEITLQTAENCKIENASLLETSQLLQELRAVPADVLVRADDNLRFWEREPLAVYTIVVENVDDNETFLNRSPDEILENGDYTAVPFLVGLVPEEGAVRSAAIWENVALRNSFNHNFDYNLEALLNLPTNFNRTRLDYIMDQIIKEYFGGQHELTRQGLLELLTDYWFHYPLYKDSKAFIQYSNTPLYLHKFNYKGPKSFVSSFTGGLDDLKYGVIHADNMFYFFNMSLADFPKSSQDIQAIKGYVDFLIKFTINSQTFVGKKCNVSNFPFDSNDSICEYITFTNGNDNEFIIDTDTGFESRRSRFFVELLKE